MTDFTTDELDQLCPEQMQRDPSGTLARLTASALDAMDPESTPSVKYVCTCDGRRHLLAIVGPTPHGPLYAAPMTGYMPGRPIGGEVDGRNPGLVAQGTDVYVAPPGASPAGQGVTYADGYITLVAEPIGYPPPPDDLPATCERCGPLTISRQRVAADLRSSNRPRIVKVHH